MEYTHFVSDFADRTLRNLDRIHQAKLDGDNVFEVTQLWNSLLGLIVVPKERNIRQIPDTPMVDLQADGWPQFRELVGTSLTLQDLVTNLRHAVAHANVDFTTDKHGEIARLTLSNKPAGNVIWKAEFEKSDLERLARLIADTYIKVFAPV